MSRGAPPPVTPDGRYFVVRGRLWRRADPRLPTEERQRLVDALMVARRAVGAAGRAGDGPAEAAARLLVDRAKRGLGERGPVWWDDGAPDLNRRMAANTPYAGWFAALLPVAGLRRHDLLRIAPADWAAGIAADPRLVALPPEAAALVKSWAERGWPAIVRRRAEGEEIGAVPLGIPLPPSLGKLRVALSLPAGCAWERVDGPGLAAAAAGAPAAVAEVAGALDRVGAAAGVVPRPFGALLWGAVTSLPYLGPGSDIDALWPVTAATDLGALLAALRGVNAAAPAPVDGEILLPDGWGVQWRELDRAWHQPGTEVLAKAVDGLWLRRVDRVLTPAQPRRARAGSP